jgi:hypothetical protein
MSNTNSKTEVQEVSELLFSAIKTAVLRAKLDANEIESVGIALSNGWIDPDLAIAWLHDIGLADMVLPERS